MTKSINLAGEYQELLNVRENDTDRPDMLGGEYWYE